MTILVVEIGPVLSTRRSSKSRGMGATFHSVVWAGWVFVVAPVSKWGSCPWSNNFCFSYVSELLCTDQEKIDKKKAAQIGIDGGVIVQKIKQGGAFSKTRMQEGFIITSVNETAVSSIESLTHAIRNYDRAYVYFECIYPEAPGAIYRYPLMLED